ncbi:unnamed protein product [Linum trigynum]|uniref:Uncharacterized protein n=1 Tax=Linum trigynum TaxID=586398 RepID=A0AAV2GFQ3_9ROSI
MNRIIAADHVRPVESEDFLPPVFSDEASDLERRVAVLTPTQQQFVRDLAEHDRVRVYLTTMQDVDALQLFLTWLDGIGEPHNAVAAVDYNWFRPLLLNIENTTFDMRDTIVGGNWQKFIVAHYMGAGAGNDGHHVGAIVGGNLENVMVGHDMVVGNEIDK